MDSLDSKFLSFLSFHFCIEFKVPGLIPVKDWEGDEAPAVGMAVKCRVVHAAGLQGTGSVCVLCVSCFCMFFVHYVHYVHYMCHVCMCHVCVCVGVLLCRLFVEVFLGSALGRSISQLRSTKRRRE